MTAYHLDASPDVVLGPCSDAPGGVRGAILARWFAGLNGRVLTTEQVDDAVVQCLRELDEHDH